MHEPEEEQRGASATISRVAPRAVLLDLLMATMNSIATWTAAAGDRERGLAWRDAVTARMIDAGRYVDYDGLVERAAATLALPPNARAELRQAWSVMQPWPDAVALEDLGVGYAFVTNCSSELAAVAVERSGLRPMFTLAAEEAGWFKPRHEVYALAVERLGLKATQVQFVAGAAYDAIGASNAGLSTVLVRRRPVRQPLPEQVRVAGSLTEALEGTESGPA
jgi:2-haloalkanoic acid dehalogenase type II